MRNRSRLDIIVNMLSVCDKGDGALKTKIMYDSNVSYPQLVEFLEVLVDRKLLSYNEKLKTYKITKTGSAVLHHYNLVQSYLKLVLE